MSICAKIVFSQNCRDVKNEVFEKILYFLFLSFFCVAAGETEKTKRRKPKKPIKIVFSGRHPNMRKMKNGFLAKIA